MEETRIKPLQSRAPWPFWAVGVISLLWNAFGAMDYTLTKTRNDAYLKNFPPEMMQVIDAFPVWVNAAWALGVWGALAGSVLLLLRSRYSVHAFAASLAGLAASTVYQNSIDMPAALEQPNMSMMNIVIWAGALFFLWYAWSMRKAKTLA